MLETAPASSRDFLEAYQQGFVCLHPSDTLPGLSVDPFNAEALAALVALKGRAAGKVSLSLIGSLAMAQLFWQKLPGRWAEALSELWPGPLSVCWQAGRDAPGSLVAADGSLALRCPAWVDDRPWMAEVLAALASPFPTSSVNLSGEPPAGDWATAVGFVESLQQAGQGQRLYAPKLAQVPQFANAQPSTLIRLHADGSFETLRAGALPVARISAVLASC